MKKQTFLKGVIILFIASLVAKFLGAIYRIPLTYVLGVEGVGLYQLVFPLFALLLVLSSAGMPTAISKMVAFYLAQNKYRKVREVFRVSLLLLGSVGLVAGVLLALLSSVIANLQSASQVSFCYLAIAPSLFLVSILSVFRGYFQGYSIMTPTAFSQILEQGGKLVLGLFFAYILLPYGVEYGVLGAIIGVTLSELIAVITLSIIYIRFNKTSHPSYKRVLYSNQVYNRARLKNKDFHILAKQDNVLKTLIKTALPIVLANIILPSITFIESLAVLNLLKQAGISMNDATSLWGVSSGVVGSLVSLPMALSFGVAISIVPIVASKSLNSICDTYNRAIGIIFVFCVPFLVGFMCLSEPIIQFVYFDSISGDMLTLASNLLIIMCASVIFGSVLQVQNATLQAVGRGRVALVNMLICGFIKLLLFFVLVRVPEVNIYGSVISSTIFYILAFGINYLYFRNKLNIKLILRRVLPSILGGMLVALFVVNLRLAFTPSVFLLAMQVFGGGALYIFSLIVFTNSKFSLKNLGLKLKKQV